MQQISVDTPSQPTCTVLRISVMTVCTICAESHLKRRSFLPAVVSTWTSRQSSGPGSLERSLLGSHLMMCWYGSCWISCRQHNGNPFSQTHGEAVVVGQWVVAHWLEEIGASLLTTAAETQQQAPAGAAGLADPPCLPEYTTKAHLS